MALSQQERGAQKQRIRELRLMLHDMRIARLAVGQSVRYNTHPPANVRQRGLHFAIHLYTTSKTS
jgi:hypothetical protein